MLNSAGDMSKDSKEIQAPSINSKWSIKWIFSGFWSFLTLWTNTSPKTSQVNPEEFAELKQELKQLREQLEKDQREQRELIERIRQDLDEMYDEMWTEIKTNLKMRDIRDLAITTTPCLEMFI